MHEGARGELRQVTDEGQNTVVLDGREHVRCGAEARRKLLELVEALPHRVARRREQPRAVLEQIRTRVGQTGPGCAAERVPPDKRKS